MDNLVEKVGVGTHRTRSSNSNTESISSMISVNSGVHHCSRSRKIASRTSHTQGSISPLEILSWDDKIMSVVRHIDEIHILSVEMTPDTLEEFLTKTSRRVGKSKKVPQKEI